MNMPHLNHHASHPQRQSPENDHQDVQAFAEQMIRDNPVVGTQIVTRAPEEPFRLSFLDATCLIVNRTIGQSTLYIEKE
jgi:hypothetical protein